MKWMKKHKILTTILGLFLALIVAVVWFLWSKLDLIEYENEIDKSVYESLPEELQVDATIDDSQQIISQEEMEALRQDMTELTIPESEVWGDQDVVNILLLGTDEFMLEFSPYSRSDSMILVSINKAEKTVKLVSLQRGMGVPVLEGEYEGQYDWLTHIFRYGGAELVRKTVETCFRVEVDHYVRINMYSVTALVDLVGGVDVELDEAEAYHFASLGYPIRPGVNHLNGKLALAYARLRSIDGDFHRIERQRKVILAVVERLKGASPMELNALADQVLPLVQTNLTMTEIAELVLYAPDFINSTFDQMTIPAPGTYGGMVGMGGRNLFAVDFDANSQVLKEFLYGTGEDSED